MVATQVQLRRGTEAQCIAMTPVEGEPIVDLTNDTIRMGDGTRLGGWMMPNFSHIQTNKFTFAVAGGTADALTLTLSPAPISLAQPLEIIFRASATNTTGATINVNGLGAVNIYKMSSGALVALAAGDIRSGTIYRAIYDGVQFQIQGLPSAGIVSVGQGDLRTSTGSGTLNASASGGTNILVTVGAGGSFSSFPTSYSARLGYTANAFTPFSITLPGGEYGFYPLVARSGSAIVYNQRYITSSPPYDLGDGEVGGFIFVLLNAAGDIVQTYIADTPPWAYNGPTDIRATHKCAISGIKYRKVLKRRSFQEVMDGAAIEYDMQEITHDIKNADMSLIPHPFGDIPKDHKVIMLDPMSDKVARLIEMQNSGYGKEVTEMISSENLIIDNTTIKRGCPKKVTPCKFKFKGGK